MEKKEKERKKSNGRLLSRKNGGSGTRKRNEALNYKNNEHNFIVVGR
jgi:hypothetical protein